MPKFHITIAYSPNKFSLDTDTDEDFKAWCDDNSVTGIDEEVVKEYVENELLDNLEIGDVEIDNTFVEPEKK